MLLFRTQGIPTYPSNFPTILTPSQKNLFIKDSIEEIIPDGALKKERP